jgi:Domain of unknown function (DUF4337)
MGRETLEPQELIGDGDLEEGGRRHLSTRITVTVALLAVLASICALLAEHSVTESILEKNEAVLWQSRASDEWAYRQAKSIKLHLQEMRSDDPAQAEAVRAEIAASEARARDDERQRDEANRESSERLAQHRRFSTGTSLLQIAIVLETVAAVLDRRAVWYGGLAVAAGGSLALLNGFLGLV